VWYEARVRKFIAGGLGAAAVALALVPAGSARLPKVHPPPFTVHPPPFTGNGSGIQYQGGTKTLFYYIYGGWLDDCNQAVHDAAGHVVGVYIDDEVNANWPSNATEIACVQKDRAAGWKVIIAAVGQSSPNWNFAPYGATYTALEWYPWCGGYRWLGNPPKKPAYVAQWNFVFNQQDIGLGNGVCPPTPYRSASTLLKQFEKFKPKLILFY
jgi:hypothetical protein